MHCNREARDALISLVIIATDFSENKRRRLTVVHLHVIRSITVSRLGAKRPVLNASEHHHHSPRQRRIRALTVHHSVHLVQ